MRIAIDVRSLMEGRLSGVEEYTTQLARAMLRVAPQHTYQLFYNSYAPVHLPEFSGNVTIRGFRYPNKAFNLLQLIAGQPRWDRLVEGDVFFSPNIRLVPLARQPLVVTAHDLSYVRFPQFYSRRRQLWHRLIRARHFFKAAQHVIAVSTSTARDIETLYGVDPAKISVVHSGVPMVGDTSSVAQGKLRSALSLPERFVLYLGTLEPRKNVASIIRAYSSIAPDVEHDLVIAGAHGWLTADIERAWQESTVKDRIHRLGFVPDEHKWALYAAADLFVYPSFYEGFGFPPLEALLAGTPVVTSFNSSLPEVVGEWATLVNPYNVSELAVVMRDLLQHPVVVSKDTQHAIRERYSWDKTARATLDILEKFAS